MFFSKIFAGTAALLAASASALALGGGDGDAAPARGGAVRVSAETALLSRQDYGETRFGSSVSGTPLRVAGTRYAGGIGTHATSMIPLDVPAGTVGFSGAVGIDDAAGTAGDGAEFRVLTGTETLWSSGVVRRGEPAKEFSVRLPPGVTKIYLLTLAGGNNWNDHADWVYPVWLKGGGKKENAASADGDEEKLPGERIFFGESFGIRADSEADQGAAFRAALDRLRRVGGGTLELEKGVYHFRAENAHEMSFWISNHDQQEIHQVVIPLVDLRNCVIRGNGSLFVFHGKCLPVLFMDSENVTLEDVRIDFARPLFSEAKIVRFERGKTVVSVDRAAFPYEVRDGRLFFTGENYPAQEIQVANAFRAGTRGIVPNTGDVACGNAAVELADGALALSRDFSKVGDGVAVGDTLTLRTYWRPAPACVVYRAKDATLRDVVIHSAFGMGLLAQRSENVTFTGTRGAAAKTSGVFPREGSGRAASVAADATHFSNVRGKVVVENSFFEAMLDDAVNVHSTCLEIREIIASDTLKCRYRHPQSIGFEVFLPGENLRFIRGATLENGAVAKVKSARRISPTEVLIQLEERIPAGTRVGDAVENADFQPEVVFRGNDVRNNRARGALFNTPKKTLVENNAFRGVAGAAILIAGDAQGWFESGACEDVLVRNNLFEDNLTSRFQFTNAVISIYPTVRDLEAQKKFCHRDIRIENNEFVTFDAPLLFALSAEKLRFENNRVRFHEKFRGWGEKPFQFVRCADVSIRGNAVVFENGTRRAPREWSLDDCRLEMTDAREIRFGK